MDDHEIAAAKTTTDAFQRHMTGICRLRAAERTHGQNSPEALAAWGELKEKDWYAMRPDERAAVLAWVIGTGADEQEAIRLLGDAIRDMDRGVTFPG